MIIRELIFHLARAILFFRGGHWQGRMPSMVMPGCRRYRGQPALRKRQMVVEPVYNMCM
jgi:hypothetical protein